MALLIVVGFAALSSWFAPIVEKPEPISEDNQPSVRPDPFTLAPMIENHERSLSPWKKYDVFLSFRGADTRRGFVSHLYHELKIVRRIETFKDDRELEIGDPIGETLLKAIEDSHFAIVVLSENYAQSPWCLEELTKICECMEDKHRILPLFYHVKPTDVRHQNGSFKDAFRDHESSRRYSLEKIQQWKKALHKVADFSGCNADEHNTDREVVADIVENVCRRVRTIENYRTFSSRDFELFEATKEAKEKVMEALKNDKITAVGLYGMGGIGKTSMVEYVAVEAYRQGLFHQWTMALISQKPNLWEIQARLASMLGVTLKDNTKYERAGELKSKIREREKILIILDDVWADIDLSDIGIPSLRELKSRNSKVFLTSRNSDVCSRMQCNIQIPLRILDDQDSWRLFEKNTGMSFESTTVFYSVAMEVAKKCSGLPVALTAVAKALGGKSLGHWKGAAMGLKGSKTCQPEHNTAVFKSLKLSYDYLESNDSKSCFLLCCLFPANYEIQIDDLLKYGIGKGLFLQSNMQEARATICSVVQSLKDSNLLLDGKMDRRHIRMHDVIRDIGLSISLTEDGHRQFFVQAGWKIEKWPTIDAHKYCTAISLMMNKMTKLPHDLVFISDANFMPSSVSCDPGWEKFDICIHRYWHIRRRLLDSSSSPVYSRVLTLDVRMETLKEWFVRFVAKKTEKLQYIQCPDLCILEEYDEGRLHELKYLSVIGSDLKELMSVKGIRNEPVFQNLEELHLDQLDRLEKLCVGELPTGSLINLRLLNVRRCHKLMNAFESNLLQRLQKLENLSCEVMDGLKYVFSSEGSGLEEGTLPKLKEMRLDNLVNLIKIWNGPASFRIFDHVKVLVLLQCSKLKNIFTYDEADNLLNLEDLSVDTCKDLERVIDASEEKVRSKIVLPKLKKLSLKNLSKLTRFYGSTGNATRDEDEENIEFPLLKYSDVQRCHSFNSPAKKKLDSMISNSFIRNTCQTKISTIRRRGEVWKDGRYGHQ
ncbi:hypothetical protein ACLB2K_030740 [Fragaria x ananassa]